VKLFPVNSTSTHELIASLSKYFEFYSRPNSRIISDRGSCFTSLEFSEFLAERNIVGKLSNPINQADWYKLINKVEHAINNSVHSSTLKTPSMILFGVDQKGPIVDELYEYL